MHNFLTLLCQFFENIEFTKTKMSLLAEMKNKNVNNKLQFLDDMKRFLKRILR